MKVGAYSNRDSWTSETPDIQGFIKVEREPVDSRRRSTKKRLKQRGENPRACCFWKGVKSRTWLIWGDKTKPRSETTLRGTGKKKGDKRVQQYIYDT